MSRPLGTIDKSVANNSSSNRLVYAVDFQYKCSEKFLTHCANNFCFLAFLLYLSYDNC